MYRDPKQHPSVVTTRGGVGGGGGGGRANDKLSDEHKTGDTPNMQTTSVVMFANS